MNTQNWDAYFTNKKFGQEHRGERVPHMAILERRRTKSNVPTLRLGCPTCKNEFWAELRSGGDNTVARDPEDFLNTAIRQGVQQGDSQQGEARQEKMHPWGPQADLGRTGDAGQTNDPRRTDSEGIRSSIGYPPRLGDTARREVQSDMGHRETVRQEADRQDAGGQDAGGQEAGRQGAGHQDVGKQGDQSREPILVVQCPECGSEWNGLRTRFFAFSVTHPLPLDNANPNLKMVAPDELGSVEAVNPADAMRIVVERGMIPDEVRNDTLSSHGIDIEEIDYAQHRLIQLRRQVDDAIDKQDSNIAVIIGQAAKEVNRIRRLTGRHLSDFTPDEMPSYKRLADSIAGSSHQKALTRNVPATAGT